MAEDALPNESPYVGGREVCAYDCALAPRLYLARRGCSLLKVRRPVGGWPGQAHGPGRPGVGPAGLAGYGPCSAAGG